MKRLSALTLTLALAFSCAQALQAQDDVQTQPSQSSAKPPLALPRLPYGVDDVLKLSRAKLTEEVVISFIENSGNTYSLRPQDIVFLRDEGVSDRVITVMLSQSKRAPTTAPAPTYVQPQPTPAPAPVVQEYAQPAPVYTQPASTLYVIPYSTPAYPYYSSYPYYGGSYPYYSSYGYSSFCYPRSYYSGGYGRSYCSPYRPFIGIHANLGHVSIGGRIGGGGHSLGGRIGGGGHSIGSGHIGHRR